MKNKIFAVILMVCACISIFGVTFAVVKPNIQPDGPIALEPSCEHSWTVPKNNNNGTHSRTCINCGEEDSENHTWDSGTITKNPNCTEEGEKKYKCTGCAATYTDSLAAYGHRGTGKWYPLKNATHAQSCIECGAPDCIVEKCVGSWEPSGKFHALYCSICSFTTTEEHNNEVKVLPNVESTADMSHRTRCSICDAWQANESHVWTGGDSSDNPHTCTLCTYVHTKKTHYYEFPSKIAEKSYSCMLNGGGSCLATSELEVPTISGMPLNEYSCSDAQVSIGAVPEFPNGEYTFSYSAVLRDIDGKTPTLEMPESWLRLTGWSQKAMSTHLGLKGNSNVPPPTFGGIPVTLVPDELPSLSNEELHEMVQLNAGPKYILHDPGLSNGSFPVNSCVKTMSLNQRSGWCGSHKGACMGVITSGQGTYDPEVTTLIAGQTFNVVYDAPDGGWLYKSSEIYPQELFGKYESEGGITIYADVYYCYRTLDGDIPEYGTHKYPTLISYDRVVVYQGGPHYPVVEIEPEWDIINDTGYRYVGAAISVGSSESVYVASKPDPNVNKDKPVVRGLSYDAESSAAIVTFFLEPVKLSYGHKAVDYKENIIDINASDHQGEDLEFPKYYSDEEGKCIIPTSSEYSEDKIEPLESLHKFYWPGYMLTDAKVYRAGTDEIIYEKEYDSTTSTYIDFENSENSRYVVNEQVPSYYENEKPGYAADKDFYYFYNTPLIDIIHKDFETGDTLLTNTGEEIKYITYLQQIINQYAYIESLITDDEKEEYTLSIRNLDGVVEKFDYSYPRRDLVQVKIYEVEDGKAKLFATLYQNESYNNGEKRAVNVDDVRFPDTYSDSLIAIIEKTGVSASEFNTNKNWKIEFIYDEVDDYVNIKYMKYKNESEQQQIYIPTQNPDGSIGYIEEIKAEIPKEGYIHTPTNLDGDKLKLFKYTISKDEYVTSIDKGNNIASGTDVTVSGDSGDWYLIFFFASDMLTVEYRDISGDVPINVPPDNKSSISLEIPEYGMELEVPEVPAYKVRYYIKDDNYISGDVSGDIIYTQEKERIPIVTNGNNQYIIIYYEKVIETSKLIIEYREDTTTGEVIRPSDETELPIGVPTKVQIPDITPYRKKFYKVNSEEPVLIADTEISTVMMQGDPTLAQQKLICVYERDSLIPDEPETPSFIVPDTNTQVVRLRANSSTNEEYNVETAIPTSEDLYVKGDVYSYRFESEIEKVNKEETLKITVRQPYYTDLDKPDEIDYVQVTIDDFLLEYGYYEIKKAELYDLKLLHLENEAIKYYDNYSYDNPTAEKYIEGQANFPVDADIFPYLEYNLPTGVDTDNDEARIQINSTAGYEVIKNSDKNYTITIRDVDYYRAVNVDNLKEQLEMEAKNIIEECTDIKVPTLKIRMNGDTTNSKVVSILMGNEYKLSERSIAMDSTVHYLPFTENRSPVEGFFFDKNLYIKESAQNQLYSSTMTGDYRMVAKILTPESTDIETYTPSGAALGSKTINVDSLNVHTPIVNKAIMEIDESNIQLNEEVRNALSGTTKILNVGEKFAIQIPNVGDHLNANGYKNNKSYNFGGLMINGAETNNNADVNMNSDSADNLMPLGIIVNTPSGAVIDQAKLAEYETEKNPKGPSFAEYKLIRFPFDVYLLNADLDGGKPVLFKANEWYNLYAYLKPSKINYEFALPNWVTDATLYSDDNGIHVLVVAENASLLQIEQAMQTPLGVTQAENNANVANKINMHIIRKTFDIYVSGRLYDLQIRDTDDPGYMNKINPALSGNTNVAPFISQELALAQKGQVAGYNLGLKLGYRFYFDLKTRGISNKEVLLTPKIYYVSLDGTTVKKPEEITLFYHSKGSMYNRLDTNDLNIRMTMAGTHGLAANNNDFTAETIAAKQLNPSRIFTNQTVIGKVISGITLKRDTEKLPYNNLKEVAELCGFGEDVSSLLTSAAESDYAGGENGIKNTTGHWYGEYYLPASTLVVLGSNVPREQVINGTYKPAPAGYLIVVFEEITTEDSVYSENGYLTYDMPLGNTQWNKEGIDSSIVLPNGKTALLNAPGAPMAIYQVNLRANNDYETEGTH